MDEQDQPVALLGSRMIPFLALGRVAHLVVVGDHSAILLPLMIAVFFAGIIYFMDKPQLVLLYLTSVLFYSSLYVRRLLRHRRLGFRPQQRRRLRRGLAYTAILLASFMSGLFFCSFDHPAGMPLSLRIGVWSAFAVAARCLYLLTVLHLEGEKDLELEDENEVLQRAPV